MKASFNYWCLIRRVPQKSHVVKCWPSDDREKPLGCCVLSLTRVPVPFLILPRVLISKCWLMDRTKIKEEVPLVFSLSVRLTWFGTDFRNDRWAAQLSMYYHSEDQSRDQNILFLLLYTHPTY